MSTRLLMSIRFALIVLCLLAVAPLARAEVVASAPGGFTSRHTATVAATPLETYQALVNDVGKWWNGAHSYSLDAANMSIDARPQGCFCEALPDGGGVRHMTVVAAVPGDLLRMSGGLGPLQANAVRGALTWNLAPAGGEDGGDGTGTSISLTYAVHGWVPDGLEAWAAPVDGVIGESLQRLARYVDTGSPEPAPEAAE